MALADVVLREDVDGVHSFSAYVLADFEASVLARMGQLERKLDELLSREAAPKKKPSEVGRVRAAAAAPSSEGTSVGRGEAELDAAIARTRAIFGRPSGAPVPATESETRELAVTEA